MNAQLREQLIEAASRYPRLQKRARQLVARKGVSPELKKTTEAMRKEFEAQEKILEQAYELGKTLT